MLTICCGNFRSGSTLQYRIASVLAVRTGRAVIAGFGLWPRLDALQNTAASALVVVKEHAWRPPISELTWSATRLVYCYRDLRDVIASVCQVKPALKQHSREDWEAEVRKLIDYYVAVHHRWVASPAVLVTRYEAMYQDIPCEVRRIAAHLHIEVTEPDISDIAQQVSLQSHESYIRTFDFARNGRGPLVDRVDPVTQLHQRHLNGGEVGKWRSLLTNEQVQFVESVAGRWLNENGYVLSNALSTS